MSDQEVRAYVDELAERVPLVEPPLAGVLAGGRAAVARRRRRRGAGLVVSAAVAAAAVVLGPSVVVPGETDAPSVAQTSVSEPTADPTADPAVDPTSAAGATRLVGAAGVVVAVPVSWVPTYQPLCEDVGVASYYVVEPEQFAARCPYFPPTTAAPVPRLEIVPPGSGRPTARCEEGAVCDRFSLGGVSFEVRLPGPLNGTVALLLTRMEASLHRLPSGSTTVPLWPTEARSIASGTSYGPVSEAAYLQILDEAGLRDAVRILDASTRTIEPPQGTVVTAPGS